MFYAEGKYYNQSYFNNESVSVILCDPPPAAIEPVKTVSISELEQSLSSDKRSSVIPASLQVEVSSFNYFTSVYILYITLNYFRI